MAFTREDRWEGEQAQVRERHGKCKGGPDSGVAAGCRWTTTTTIPTPRSKDPVKAKKRKGGNDHDYDDDNEKRPREEKDGRRNSGPKVGFGATSSAPIVPSPPSGTTAHTGDTGDNPLAN